MARRINFNQDEFNEARNDQFARDISTGLLNEKKTIPSLYFYDDYGSDLFNKITRHPDYYLTSCELEILHNNKKALSDLLKDDSFNLVELGPGEGIKARIIIEQFLNDSLDFTYFTVDISRKYLDQISSQFQNDLPRLKLQVINADFCNGLKWLNLHTKKRNMVLFLGSSIGNFDKYKTEEFLKKIWQELKDGDYLFIGFDLKKDIDLLLQAYNDKDGITREFNLNLLHRINRELNANFKIDHFDHFATYNVYSGAMESYIISLKEQNVYSEMLKQTFHFHEFEPIHVEFSYKYLRSQIEKFAANAGFEILNHYSDSKGYFINSLWRVCK